MLQLEVKSARTNHFTLLKFQGVLHDHNANEARLQVGATSQQRVHYHSVNGILPLQNSVCGIQGNVSQQPNVCYTEGAHTVSI